MEKKELFDVCYNKIKQSVFDIHTLKVEDFMFKCLGYKTRSDREKIDALLELDAFLYTNMGKESLVKDKTETKRRSKQIYTAIKSIDETIGKSLLDHMDAKK